MVRDEIPLHSVPYAFIVSKRGMGYIRLVNFDDHGLPSHGTRTLRA